MYQIIYSLWEYLGVSNSEVKGKRVLCPAFQSKHETCKGERGIISKPSRVKEKGALFPTFQNKMLTGTFQSIGKTAQFSTFQCKRENGTISYLLG